MTHPTVTSMSLARRYLLASFVVVLGAGIAVALWVGVQIEKSVLERTASVTAPRGTASADWSFVAP